MDEIAIKTITQLLDADLSALPPATVDILKRINIHNIQYTEKKALIQSLVDSYIFARKIDILSDIRHRKITVVREGQFHQPEIRPDGVHGRRQSNSHNRPDCAAQIREYSI